MVRNPVREYHVYDEKSVNFGGRTVVENKEGARVILMSEAEAQYFLDQGGIGEKAMERKSARAFEVAEQMTGVSEPKNIRK